MGRSEEQLNLAIEVESMGIPHDESIEEDLHIHPDRVGRIQASDNSYIDSGREWITTTETDIHNEVIENCELFLLEQSKQERKALGRKNRQASRVIKRQSNKEANKAVNKAARSFKNQTEGIDGSELRRRMAAGECQRCAWPRDRKGIHKTLDCFRWKRLEKGTATFPKK